MVTSCRKIVTSFFLFMANLQPSQSRIPDGTIFVKKYWFLQIKADISKIKGILVLKDIFSETTDECVLTYRISSF